MQMASKLHAILTRFREDRPTWRQVDLARALELSPSALSRSLSSLVETGFLRFDAETGTYRLGPTIVSLAGAAINEYEEFRHAYAELHALMAATLLGANLAVPDDDRLMYLFHLDGPKMKRGNTLVGRHAPLHATALGKALLSGESAEALEAWLADRTLPAYTVHTITDPARLRAELAEVRARGYAIEREELALGPRLHRGPHPCPRGSGRRRDEPVGSQGRHPSRPRGRHVRRSAARRGRTHLRPPGLPEHPLRRSVRGGPMTPSRSPAPPLRKEVPRP